MTIVTKWDALAEQLAAKIENAISLMPPKRFAGLYDTFEFTRTGNNLCHSLTVGLLARIVGDLDEVAHVGVDVRLNDRGGLKFQPDVVGFRGDLSPVVYVDFESPNSSDARIPLKDVQAYLTWVKGQSVPTPYVIVTSLPNCSRTGAQWELRWTSQCNAEHKGKMASICANPFRYWTGSWKKALRGVNLAGVVFLNIDGLKVRPFRLNSAAASVHGGTRRRTRRAL